jgi:S1-C subfamily serine protease
MPTRRRYLGLLVGLAGATAGCGSPGQQATTRSTTTSTTEDRDVTDVTGTSVAESPYTEVYRDAISSIVYIRATLPQGTTTGSGFVYDSGHVVTNHHVVADASSVTVRFNRGDWSEATVVGSDAYSDLATLSVERPDYATPLGLVDAEPAIGTEVVAIGHPFGLDRSATTGIISGVNRNIPAPAGTFDIADGIQTDAAVNPGNSGGPLVTLEGEVAGVVSSGGGENVAFAVSVPLLRRVVPSLIEDGEYTHPYMGVTLTTVTPAIATTNDLQRPSGVIVDRVLEGGPAAGTLQPSPQTEYVDGTPIPVGGDVIVALDDHDIAVLNDLSEYLALETAPGDELSVTVLRDGERTTVSMELGARPEPGTLQASRATAATET